MAIDYVASTVLIATVIAGNCLVKIGAAVLKQKGENLANKQDVEKITNLVKSVEAKYISQIEMLKSKLDRSNTVHQVQFEAEFKIYQTLHELAHQAFAALVRFKPMAASGLNPSSGAKERFFEAQLDFATALQKAKPFIAPRVMGKFLKLSEIILDDKIEIMTKPDLGSHEPSKAKREALTAAFEKCGDAIRARLKTVLVVSP